MSSEQNEQTALIPEIRVPNGQALVQQTLALIDANMLYPEGQSTYWYVKQLVGLPFAITSEPRYATNPAKTVTREDGSSYTMQPQDVAQVTIRFFNADEVTFGEPRLATLSGAFLLNQVRAMTLHELTGNIWTVVHRPGPKYSTPAGQARMLKVYEHGKDFPPELGADAYAGSALAADPIGPAHLASTILEGRPLPPDKPTAKARQSVAELRAKLDAMGEKPWHAPSIATVVDAG